MPGVRRPPIGLVGDLMLLLLRAAVAASGPPRAPRLRAVPGLAAHGASQAPWGPFAVAVFAVEGGGSYLGRSTASDLRFSSSSLKILWIMASVAAGLLARAAARRLPPDADGPARAAEASAAAVTCSSGEPWAPTMAVHTSNDTAREQLPQAHVPMKWQGYRVEQVGSVA